VGFDFTLGGSGSQTVAAGQMATFTLTFAPEGGPGGTFTFQCGGLPQYSGCTINPTSSVVAGNATGSETVQITTGQSSAAQARPATRFGLLPLALAGGLLLLPLASRRGRRIGIALLLVAFVGGVSSCAGSGGGGGGTPPIQPTIDNTPAGTYTIPVTVSANGVQQTVSLTLVVD
jgi:hypothetical protein